MITLPNKIFFTGVPGSRWSGIAQTLETIPGFNTSDRNATRQYVHNSFTGHVGAYYGAGMEFEANLDIDYIDSAWGNLAPTRIIKSHDWAYKLDKIKRLYSRDWIMLVYRPDQASLDWWIEAGGFNITYPKYDSYVNIDRMYEEIAQQNGCILDFAKKHHATWKHWSSEWVLENFNHGVTINTSVSDILVTIIK